MSDLATMIKDVGEKFNSTAGELNSRMREMEMRWDQFESSPAGRGMAANDNRSPLYDAVMSSEAVRGLSSSTRGKAVISLADERADITSANTTVGAGRSAGTSLVEAQRLPGIVTPAERRLTIRDVVGSAQTSSSNVEYVIETGFTNNAAPQVETQPKAKSDLTFDLRSAPVRTLAHIFVASKQILDDAPALAGYINNRGSYGLRLHEENQILNGDGTGQNLNGIVPQATAFDESLRATGSTRVDIIRRAIQQVRRSELQANAIMMHPDDWAEIELTKDLGENYVVGNPLSPIQPRLWGLPVIQTTAITAGEFLTGAFDIGAQIFDRQQVTVEISTEHADFFERNLVAIRVESRLALAVFRPNAFVSGGFAA